MKCLLTIAIIFSSFVSLSQPVLQASIGAGSRPTSVRLYIRPLAAVNGPISTMNFNVAIPESVAPTPVLSIINNPFPLANFQINATSVLDGYIHYNISALSSPFTLNIGAMVETEVLELDFNNGTTNSTTVSLVTLIDGGFPPFYLFFANGAAVTNGSNLYYTRAGTTVTNNFSYTFPTFSPSGTGISTAVLDALVLLPIKWLSFDVIRQGNDAILNWTVSDEENNEKYILTRSLNGMDFTPFATVNKTGSGNGVKNYSFTDPNIDSYGADVVYYRIQQVDIDRRSSLSDVRMIKLGRGNGLITAFPNPVTKGFYVNVPLDNQGNKMVTLNLIGNTGQLVQTRKISALQASNYYFDISSVSMAAGQYQLQIILEGQVLKTIKLMVNKE